MSRFSPYNLRFFCIYTRTWHVHRSFMRAFYVLKPHFVVHIDQRSYFGFAYRCRRWLFCLFTSLPSSAYIGYIEQVLFTFGKLQAFVSYIEYLFRIIKIPLACFTFLWCYKNNYPNDMTGPNILLGNVSSIGKMVVWFSSQRCGQFPRMKNIASLWRHWRED